MIVSDSDQLFKILKVALAWKQKTDLKSSTEPSFYSLICASVAQFQSFKLTHTPFSFQWYPFFMLFMLCYFRKNQYNLLKRIQEMVFKQGSRSIGCTNYVLRVANSQESKIIQLLESYGKEVTDFGGLEKGIAYDRSFIKRRPASQSLPNDANEYAIIYWQTYGQPEEVFKTFSDLYKELQQILDSPEDPKDREEVAALTKLFNKHSETIKDDGWRNKITFGKNNSMFKKVSQIPGFASISQYYVIYFVVGRLAAKNRAINNSPDLSQQQSYQNFDNFCARLDDYILDNSEK